MARRRNFSQHLFPHPSPLSPDGVHYLAVAVGQMIVRRSLAVAERRRQTKVGGKSELRRAVRRVTPGQGDLKESGTENIPPAFARFARFGGAGP